MKKRLLALLLTAAMLLSMTPVYAGEAADVVITGFTPLAESTIEAETGTVQEDLGLPETVTATVLETVDGVVVTDEEGETSPYTTEVERDIPVTWSTPLFSGYHADRAGEYTFTAGARGYDLAEGVEWPVITVILTQAEETDDGAEETPAAPVITALDLGGDTKYEMSADEALTADAVAAFLAEENPVTATVDGEDVVLPVTWACPDFDGQTDGTYTFTAYAEGYTLAEGVEWPAVTVQVAGVMETATYTVSTYTDLKAYLSLTTSTSVTVSNPIVWDDNDGGGITLGANSKTIVTDGKYLSYSGTGSAATFIVPANGYFMLLCYPVSSLGTDIVGLYKPAIQTSGSGATIQISYGVTKSFGSYAINLPYAASVTIFNSTVTSGATHAIYSTSASTIKMESAYAAITSDKASGIYNTGAATINITAGTVTAATYGIYNSGAAKITISGGTVTGTNYSIYDTGTASTLSITGGTFNGAVYSKYRTKFISGGTFSVKPDDSYIADGYTAVANSDGTWTVQEGTPDPEVAAVTTASGAVTNYTSLQAAVNAAGTGDTVTLLDNVEETITVSSSFDTLDWSGYTLTGGLTVNSGAVVNTIQNTVDGDQDYMTGGITGSDTATLIINGTVGEIAGGRYQTSAYEGVTVTTGGTLNTISGGWFTGQCLAVCWYTGSNGSTAITGGVFDAGTYATLGQHKGTSDTSNSLSADKAIVLTGGYFGSTDFLYDTNTVNQTLPTTGTLTDSASALPTGYGGISGNAKTYYAVVRDNYYVSATGSDTSGTGAREKPYATLTKALSAVADGGTVYVMDDITLASANTANTKNVTITTDPEAKVTDEDGQIVPATAVVTVTGTQTVIRQIGGATLTLKNIVFDGSGNTGTSTGAPFVIGTAGNDTDSGKLVMDSGAVIRNFTSNFGAVWANTSADSAVTIKAGASITGNTNIYDSTKDKYVSGYGGGVTLLGGTLTMEGGEISGNTASQRGGGVYVAGGTFTMTGGKISGNKVTTVGSDGAWGGGVYVTGGTFVMSGGEISGNTFTSTSLTSGGGVSVGKGSTFTMTGGAISDNAAGASGGGVFVGDGNSTFTMEGGEISGNTAGSNGGGVCVYGAFTMEDGVISGNTATTYGGGVYVAGTSTYTSTLSLTGGTISGNQAVNNTASYGGGVYLASGTTFTMEGGTITDNQAVVNNADAAFAYGGGVYMASGASFTMSYGEISGNAVKGGSAALGGGVYVTGGDFTMAGGTISGNTLAVTTSDTRRGGGVYVTGGSFTMEGGTISGNTTSDGGGVYVSDGTFTLTDGEISGNTASISGGGVYVNCYGANGTFTMEGGTITGNTASTYGGGVYVFMGNSKYTSTFSLTGGEISGNTAGTGGGVYLSNYAGAIMNLSGNVTITGNTLADETTVSNLYSNASAKLNVTGTLTGSVGVTDAGAVKGGTFATASSEEIAAASAGAFSDDTGIYQAAVSGVSLVWTADSTAVYVSSAGNDTSGDGTRGKPYLTLYKALDAVEDGGTVYVMNNITQASGSRTSTKNVTITTDPEALTVGEDGTVTGAAVVTVTGANSAIVQSSGATLTLKDIVFSGSGTGSAAPFILGTANDNTDSGKLVLDSGAVIRNFSTYFGAVWTNTNADNAITIKAGASITGNKNTYNSTNYNTLQSGFGGGVTLRGGTLTMEGGAISGNTATNGGGVYVTGGTFIMTGGEISGNTDNNYGGGVSLYNGATFTMTGGKISGNKVTISSSGGEAWGGGVYVYGSTFTMTGGEISGNTFTGAGTTYGGGVAMNNGASFTMTGGTISNSTAAYGGGVYMNDANGSITMKGGEISGNTASSFGGGVCVYRGTFTLEDGAITGNTAVSGGGVAVGVYASAADSISFTMTGGEISDNTAASYGGGVYMYFYSTSASYAMTSTFTMTGGTITGNTAQDGGGVAEYGNVTNLSMAFKLAGGSVTNNTASSFGGGVYVGGGSNNTFTLESGEVSGNTAGSDSIDGCGGGVYVTGGTFVMSGGEISGNTGSGGGGGGVYATSGTLTMEGGTISGNTATKGGGGVYVTGGTFVMSGGEISGNTGNGGGGVSLYNRSTFTMKGGVISGNTVTATDSSVYGGGVYLTGNATFTMEGGVISGNTATATGFSAYGGGVYVAGGTFTMEDSEISGNTADYGGGVYLFNHSSVAMNLSGAVTITGNTLSDGETASNLYRGAVGTVTVTGVLTGDVGVTDADASQSGRNYFAVATSAAIAAASAGAFFNDTTAEKAIANGTYLQWGIYKAAVTKADGTETQYISLQDAVNAAGEGDTVTLLADVSETVTISTSFDTLEWNGYTLTGNLTVNKRVNTIQNTVDGQQNYVTGGVSANTLVVAGTVGEIKGGRYNLTGGDSSLSEALTILSSGTLGAISGGWFTGSKLAVCWYGGSAPGSTVITGGVFDAGSEACIGAHLASLLAGREIVLEGGYFGSTDFTYTSGAALPTTGTLASTASTLPEGYGGITGSTKTYYAVMRDSYYVSANGSDTDGYGTREYPYATLYKALTQVADGGTVYVMDDITHVSADTSCSKNVTITTDPEAKVTDEDGQIVPATAVVTVTGTNSIIIWSGGGTLTLKNIVFDGSSRSDGYAPIILGSADVSTDSGKLVLDSGAVIRNFASNYGAVWTNTNANNAITIKAGASITGNTSMYNAANSGLRSGHGGGITLQGGTLTMEGGTISGNTASNGGGVYVSGGTFTMEGGEISGNTAKEAGGGVYAVNATFTMTGGKITGNQSTGSTTNVYGGGGVYVNCSAFTMEDGEISDNTASTSYGGGVYVIGSTSVTGTVNLRGGEISGNTAIDGGGAFVYIESAFNMTGGTITGNKVSGTGGGVHLFNTNSNTLNLSGGATITGNAKTDENAAASNVYLSSGAKINVTDTLTGTVGVSDAGAAEGRAFAAASSADIAAASAGAFTDDTDTYQVAASGTSLVWGIYKAAVTTADGTQTQYISLQAAVNAAGEGDTVTLLADVSETVTISTSFDTLEWNGYTLTGALTVNGTVNTIQNTVDGEQNYVTGGVSANTLVIAGTVGEIKGGRYNLTGGDSSLSEALTIPSSGTLGAISGGWFTGSKLAVCWYGGSAPGSTVITGGVFDAGSEACIGAHLASLLAGREIVLEGGYFGSTDFTYTSGAALPTTGTLGSTASTLPTGYGGITGNTKTYYAVMRDSCYVSANGSDTAGDGTREYPYATLPKALSEVADGGTIYVMDDITHTGNGTSYRKNVTITTDPEAKVTDEDGLIVPATAVVTVTGTNSIVIWRGGATLTLKNIVFDGSGRSAGNAPIILGNTDDDSDSGALVLDSGAVIRNFTSNFGAVRANTNANNAITIKEGASITGNKSTYSASYLANLKSGNGGGVTLLGGTLTMEGGEISGNTVSNSNYNTFGGGVYVGSGATFTMTGGTISGNEAAATQTSTACYARGGGVYVASGATFTMTGGTISGNKNTHTGSSVNTGYGGGVYVVGTFNLEGGAISGNTATGTGGGVGMGDPYTGSVFTMTGGTITDNTAKYGGGVYLHGNNGCTFTMTGGEISGNKAAGADNSCGGGVYVGIGTFRLEGGVINGNTAATSGGGVYVNNSAASIVNLSGDATIAGNTLGDETTVSNLYRSASAKLNVTGNLTGSVGVTDPSLARGVTFATASSEEIAAASAGAFFDDTDTYIASASGTSLVWAAADNAVYVSSTGSDTTGAGTRNRPYLTLTKALTEVDDGGNIYVMDDITHANALTVITKDVTITTDPEAKATDEDGQIVPATAVVNATNPYIMMSGGATLTLKNIVFDGTERSDLGAIFQLGKAGDNTDSGKLVLDSGAVIRNFSSSYGAVWTNTNADNAITINAGASITGNTSTYNSNYSSRQSGCGGAITLRGGTLTMEGGVISGNAAVGTGNVDAYGGGVYVGSGATFTMTGGEISGNTASNHRGGGVAVREGGTFIMEGGIISGNTTGTNGGGVHVNNSTFTMKGGTITGNTASQRGGGVDVYGGGVFNMEGGVISGNTSTSWSGGGVYLEGSAFTMTDGEISGNTGASGGGGVSVNVSSTFTMEGGSITDNDTTTTTAGGGGVAVYGGSTFTMTGGEITGNTAPSGGGVWLKAEATNALNLSGSAAITGNALADEDATVNNVYLGANAKINVTGNLTGSVGVTDASLARGITFATASSADIAAASAGAFFDDTDTYIASASGTSLVWAAADNAVYVSSTGSDTTGDGTRSRPYATLDKALTAVDDGGTIYVMDDITHAKANTVITKDVTITTDPEAKATDEDGQIVPATAVVNATNPYIMMTGGATLTLKNIVFDGTGRSDNGSIFVLGKSNDNTDSGKLVLDSGAVIRSFSSGYGPVWTNTSANNAITIKAGASITGNTSTYNSGLATNTNTSAFGTGNGGAITLRGGTLTMEGGVISGNAAVGTGNVDAYGGGVYVGSGATFNMTGGTITNNTVTSSSTADNQGDAYGGGVYVTGGTFNMTGGEISGNKGVGYSYAYGGGVAVYGGSTFTMTGGEITGNTLTASTANRTYGGGVRVNNSTFTMKGGVISGNSAENGGGVCENTSATFRLEGGEISGNTALYRGGGVYAANSTFTMTGGTITNNTTSSSTTVTTQAYGGGVCVNGGATFTMEGGKISGNTADDYGGGVYVNNDATSIVNLSGNVTITGNTLSDDDATVSNLYRSASAKLNVTGTLTGTVGVTDAGAAEGSTFATASSADIATASAGAFFHDAGTYTAVASGTSLQWASAAASVTKADGTVTRYTTLQAAVDAAEAGDTVTLLADVSETVTISTGFDTLEWNGCTLNGALTVAGTVNVIQNTVDGQQNYVTGGVSAHTLGIAGTVGEIKGGRYNLTGGASDLNEALTVQNGGTLGAISGGWFTGKAVAVCWYANATSGAVITGGVFDAGTSACLGVYGGTMASSKTVALEGGYFGSTDFTYATTLPTTGTLGSTASTLPEGYGGITGNTKTYYTLAQSEFYVSSAGSDTDGDGTRSNPYLTVNAALTALSGIDGTIYIMDSVDFGSANSINITSKVTIKGDPQRDEGVEARVTTTTTAVDGHLIRINSNSTLTVEDVIFDGNGTQRGFVWFVTNGTSMTLNLNQGAVVTNFSNSDRTYGGIISIANNSTSGSAVINLNGGQVTGNSIGSSLGAIVLYAYGTLNISGDSAVTGNYNKDGEPRNIVVDNTTQLVLSGDFTGTAGVYQSGAAAGGQFGTMGSTAYTGAGSFTCDTNPSLSSAASSGKLVWAANRDDVYVSLNGSDTAGDGTESNPYRTLLYAYGKVNAGGTIHVMTANVPTAAASGYVNAVSKYIAVSKSVTISGEGYEGASIRHNNGNAPILLSNSSSYTTTFKSLTVTSPGTTLKSYGNADNALIDIRSGTVTLDTVTVTGHYNNGDANGRANVDWSDGTLRVAGGTLNLIDTTVTGNTTNGAVYKLGGTVNLSGTTSITGNTRQGTGGANLYLKTSSQFVNVADDFDGSVGVTQVGAAMGVVLAKATSEEQAAAKTAMFTDDANTGFEVRTDDANLVWGKDIVTYVPDKYRIVVISDNADETFTITKNGVTLTGTKVYDEELGQYITTFEGLDPSTTYPVTSSKGTTQNVTTLAITALEKAIKSASPFTIYEGETISLATVLGSKVSHLSGCVSLTDMSVGSTDIATVSGTGRTAKITGVTTGNTTLKLTASTRGCAVYGTCNTGEIEIEIIVVPNVVIRTTVADRSSIVVGDCSTKLMYTLVDASGNTVPGCDWVYPSDDGEGGLYVRFEGLSDSTTYTVVARYGDGDNDYGTASKVVKTDATSALQKAIESASPFTIYEGETVTLASVLGSKVYHLSGCVSLSNLNVADTSTATVSGSGRTATITGVKLGSTQITMTAATRGCAYYGTTTANGVTITVNVIPRVQIKAATSDKTSILVTACDSRFQYALYDASGNLVSDFMEPTQDDEGNYYVKFEGLSENTSYTVVARYGDGNNSYGTASKVVKTDATSALQKAIESASPFTIYEGETVTLASVLGSKVYHLSGCVSLSNLVVANTNIATVVPAGANTKITGVALGSTQITMTAATRGCAYYGTTTADGVTITVNVIPRVQIKAASSDKTSILVTACDSRFQYALYDASGNLVSDFAAPTLDDEGNYYVKFDGLSENTSYTVVARYGDGDNDYGTASKVVKTDATSALQKAIESASPFTIYEGETVTLASVLGSKVYHLSGCVSLSNLNVADTSTAAVSGSGRTATITGVKLGSTQITMTAATSGCYYYGTTTADGVTITVIVVPKLEIKSTAATTESITVSSCDSRFQYALYDADGNPVGDTEWLTPDEDGTITWNNLADKTGYTVVVRYGDGGNDYGTASKTVTTGQSYTAAVEELYSYSQGTGVTAGFKVTMDSAPSGSYTVQVTDANGNSVGTAALQGSYYGGNYVVKVTGLTAGTTYSVQAMVNGAPAGEALEWTAPAATYSSHSGTSNTSGYWSSDEVSTSTNSSGAVQVVSGISYGVKTDNRVDIQGYDKTKTTFSNAGWTVKTSGSNNLQVWAEPTIVKGASGADYVVLTYYIRNNSASTASSVWLGANADIMIGSNDRAPVYKTEYGIRTAVSTDEDALSFAIITQNGDGVAQYADTVSTVWFGNYSLRSANTFSNTSSTSLSGIDSGAAFSWKIGTMAAGEIQSYSVVIGVAGTEGVANDTSNLDAFTNDATNTETTTETGTKLAAPTVTGTTTESVTINVTAGQTYILRLSADGESYMTYEATESGTYTFEGLAPSSTYYVYTKMTEQDADASPFYIDSDNATAKTKAIQPGAPAGVFDLKDALKSTDGSLTYTFPEAEATLTNAEDFKNLSVMVDTGSFTLTQEALAALGSYTSVAGVNTSGGYVKTATAGSQYTYLIFTGSFTKEEAEGFLQALTFTAAGYGVYQKVDVDADVIDLPSGVARLGSSYYRYVSYRGITWANAYKAAKASSFNGLTGYLITVDSAVEHNFVYQTYGSVNGWMGGLRTNATTYDTATFNPVNPGSGVGTWKWVCGPNAGTIFWNGTSGGRAVPGVYSNWNSGEPNNSTNEFAAQYGHGASGKWNDYSPTNSAIGGYFIEYTAYGSYAAANPMAHDDKSNVFGEPVAVILVNGSATSVKYPTLADALADYTDSGSQVIQMIADTTEDTVSISQDVYLDLNGKKVNADITVGEGFTLYGVDTTTDGYQNLNSYGAITGEVTGTVGAITKTTTSHFAKAKTYLPVSTDSGLEFHRFNTVVYKYTGKIDNEADTATLNYTLGFQGDGTVVGQLEAIGAGARISGSGNGYTYGWNYDLSAVPNPSNPYLYDTNLVNLSTTDMVNGYTTYYDLVGALKFGEFQVDSESVSRSFLQVLKLYYKKATAEEQTEIETFVTKHNLTTEWEALG